MKKGKSENAFEGLMSRQDYLVVQANDLAKAFGNLKALQQIHLRQMQKRY